MAQVIKYKYIQKHRSNKLLMQEHLDRIGSRLQKLSKTVLERPHSFYT